MKEYLYRKKVIYQSRPAFIVLDLLAALAIIFSGPFFFEVLIFEMFMRIALPHSQVQYFLPRRYEDIKKQSIMKVTMICMEKAICMLVWLIPSFLLYGRLGSMIRQFPVFMILWMFVMMLALFRIGIDAEQNKWKENGDKDIRIFVNIRHNRLKAVTEFFAGGFLFSCLGGCFFLGWWRIVDLNYQNPVNLILLVVTMILILIDIYRGLKTWSFADYDEADKIR